MGPRSQQSMADICRVVFRVDLRLDNDPDDFGDLGARILHYYTCLQSAPLYLLSHPLSPGSVFMNPQVSNSIILEWSLGLKCSQEIEHQRKPLPADLSFVLSS